MVKSLRQLFDEYIFKKSDIKKGTVMPDIAGTDYGESRDLTYSLSELRDLIYSEPVALRGIKKRSLDAVREWHELRFMGTNDKVAKSVNDVIDDFVSKTRFKQKLYLAGLCSGWAGDGYIEMIFFNDKKQLYEPVTDDMRPANLVVLNPENIKKTAVHPKTKEKCFVYSDLSAVGSSEIYIHPSRLLHLREDFLPESDFGMSKGALMKSILEAKKKSDEASGDIIKWFSHGIMTMKINNMSDEQQRKMLSFFKKHPDYYVFDEDYEFDIKNPAHIDPTPFYDNFDKNIGCGVGIPKQVLLGQDLGNVTGSETGLADYYHDIGNMQTLVYSPVVEQLYRQIVVSHGKKWKYDIFWFPIYVDELSEAKILQTRTYAAVQLKNAGVIDNEEARSIIVDGVVNIDSKDVPDVDDVVSDKPDVSDPNIEPQPAVKPKQYSVYEMTPEQKEMISKRRELGMRELVEQEKRLLEAKKRVEDDRNVNVS